MFYLWPIDRCSNSRTSLCWQSARSGFILLSLLRSIGVFLLSSRKPCDSYPKIDRSRRTLAKNDLPSSGADVGITREMGFPYIYIYCISISRVFSCFLTFFARFWILSFFCVVSPGKSLFFKETRHLSDIAIFGFRFFRSHSKRWDFRFYRFFDFWPFFLSF